MSELKLTLKDRIILRNQYRILELLDKKESDWYGQAVKILESGYALEYGNLTGAIDPSEISEDTCREVINILDMYRFLQWAFRDLKDKSGIKESELSFPGFDGNNESAHLSYGRFLNTTKRFEESKVENSHMPTLEVYRRMLAAYGKVKDKHQLTKVDVQAILAAQIHPTMRSK